LTLALNALFTVAVFTLLLGSLLLVPSLLGGCAMQVEKVARPSYKTYGRVAVLGELSRQQEELFVPVYMKAFPYQAVVERRDLEAIVGEQDLRPERLNEQTRARVRRILGVTALLYVNYTEGKTGQLSVKAVDTETGEIVANVLVTRLEPFIGDEVTDRRMIYRAVDELKSEVERASARGEETGVR